MLALDRYPSLSAKDGIPGRPIVLVGSLGSTKSMWRRQLAPLRTCGPVITVDLRGHGESQVLDVDTTMADLAVDVLTALDQIGIGRAHFIGVSLGGGICQQIALDHPERVDRLVLMCTAPRFGTPEVWAERIETVTASGTQALVEGVLAKWFTPEFAAAEPDVIREATKDFTGTDDTGYARACQALAGFDVRERLAEISAPTLVVAGDRDESTPAEVVRLLADGIPDARWELVAGGAHLLNIEYAEQVNPLLVQFLGAPKQSPTP